MGASGGMMGAGMALGMASGITGLIGAAKMRKSFPSYKPYDYSAGIAKGIGVNQKNLPAIEQTATEVNRFSQEQLNKALETATGGRWSKMVTQSGDLIQSMMAGEVPAAEVARLRNLGAALGITRGTMGSDLDKMGTLSLIGRTSIGLMEESLGAFDRWSRTVTQTGVAPQMSVTSEFVNPMQFAGAEAEQHLLQFQNQLGKWSLGNEALDWSKALGQASGMMMGMGGGGMMGGGGGQTNFSPMTYSGGNAGPEGMMG